MYQFYYIYDQYESVVTTVSEIRNLATTAEKAIDVIKRHYCQNDRFWVTHVDVDGSIYDCEFERGLWGVPTGSIGTGKVKKPGRIF